MSEIPTNEFGDKVDTRTGIAAIIQLVGLAACIVGGCSQYAVKKIKENMNKQPSSSQIQIEPSIQKMKLEQKTH